MALFALISGLLVSTASAADGPNSRPKAELRWGGDAEGGEPFVAADPNDPARVVGFDVEIASLLADGIGRRPRFVQAAFAALDAGVSRGDFDIALSGIEDSPARRARLAVSVPYYEFREVLTVRAAEKDRYRTLQDLRGRRVATLGSTLAADLLRDAAGHGVTPIVYEDDVHPYSDLALGRVDAVLLDQVLAERGVSRNPGLLNQPEPVATGHYVAVMARQDLLLRSQIDGVLRAAMADGRLEQIFRRWRLWNDDQVRLYARLLSGDTPRTIPLDGFPAAPGPSSWTVIALYLPSLVRAASTTLLLSCAAMALAVLLGALIATGRLYAGPSLRFALAAWVEVVRGTPLLLQLFVIYFGLAPLIRLPALIASLLGLGLNYAAYESEIYRGALEAVPRGQLEAARALGLTDWQALVHIRAPQALRFALAPMTNDFVALLKDSSLVSVITVVELTKQTSILAANIGSWVLPGAVCAAIYLGLSLPLAALARRLEKGWRLD